MATSLKDYEQLMENTRRRERKLDITLIIGIDCGVNTGLAFYCPYTRKLLSLYTVGFWKAMDLIDEAHRMEGDKLQIVIEDVTQNKSTFRRDDNIRTNDRKARNVGSVQAYCTLMMERFEQWGISVVRMRPNAKSQTKLSHEEFVNRTGWEGKTSSSHSRDAGMLVSGR